MAALAAMELDAGRSPAFDIFPYLASKLFGTPMAAVSFVERDRQWFKASVGLDATETPRDVSFCAHALLAPNEVLYVPDATKDPRFSDNDLVVGDFALRFYAGCPVIGPSGHPVGAVCVIDREPRTVSAEDLEQLRYLALGIGSALSLHASVRQLERQAHTDALTGLLNRAGFEERLAEAVERCRRSEGQALGLLFLDLDGFKAINDLFGHGGGDAALREVAQRLRGASRGTDVLCRFGGDEFCILVLDATEAGLSILAQRIHQALTEPFALNQQSVPLRTSIGIASAVGDRLACNTLIMDADAALYRAKRAGRGTTQVAALGDTAKHARPGRIGLHERLWQALVPAGREPFTLALQPLFDGRTEQLRGFEALVRWPQADGSVMAPGDFIPVAEATGLIVELDHWAVDAACRLAAQWPEDLTISSNLSAANFLAGGLVDVIRSSLRRHGLLPKRLKLEITETTLLHEPARVRSVMAELRNLGVRMVLDDFGAGHASIGYLRQFAFDELKIDRSLTAGIETDTQCRVLVGAIIDMGHALGMDVTAEGVETRAQLRRLAAQGASLVQGYLLGRPMAPAFALALIRMSTDGPTGGRSQVAREAALF